MEESLMIRIEDDGELVEALIRERIELIPVLRKGTCEVIRWHAGRRGFDKQHPNVVQTNQFATGLTPFQAVERLLNGQTCWIWVEDGEIVDGYSMGGFVQQCHEPWDEERP